MLNQFSKKDSAINFFQEDIPAQIVTYRICHFRPRIWFKNSMQLFTENIKLWKVLVEQLSHAITMHVLTLFAFFMATGAQPTQQIHMAAFRIITSNVFMHQVLTIFCSWSWWRSDHSLFTTFFLKVYGMLDQLDRIFSRKLLINKYKE